MKRIKRSSKIASVERVLGKTFKVLDDGFVRLVDYMGSDSAIVQAARVSYGAGTKKINEDRGLIRYLMRHQHTTPFEMCELKLHIRVPMDTWRQWIRHRTANVNEYSTRYSVAIDSMQATIPSQWRVQSVQNRQGSSGLIDLNTGKLLSMHELDFQGHARRVYKERLAAGVAREQARKDLPLSTYTEAYWKTDLHNLFHFLALRMDINAQYEIRSYAKIIGNEIVSKWCPMSWEAFSDYRLNSTNLSHLDLKIVQALNSNAPQDAVLHAARFGWLDSKGVPSKNNRERKEAEEKLENMGFAIPWGE